MDLSAYEVTGTNNPAKQVSVTKWNALLADLETGVNLGSSVTPQQFQVSSGLSLPLGGGVQDDSPAFVAAIAYLKSIAINDGVYYKGSAKLYIPIGNYYLGTTTLDITHTLIIEGESTVNGYGSRLNWAAGTTGIRIQAYNTNGNAGVDIAPYHYSGSFTQIRNLGLRGPYPDSSDFTGHTEGDYHGIHVRSNVVIEDVFIDGFQGDGVHALTSVGGGGAEEGNSNVSFINRLRVANVRNGLYLDGADANAWTCIGIYATYCRQHTVWDSSFLGNTHIGHHSANAGLIPGVPASVVHYLGNRFCVKQGQSVGAATNAPPATATDNTYWLYISAGGADASLNIPTWANPTSVREGGGYRTDSLNGYNVFIGCYQEGGEGRSQFVSPTAKMGGLIDLYSTGNQYNGSSIIAPGTAALGETTVQKTGTGNNALHIHNSEASATGVNTSIAYEQGYRADGTTPNLLVRTVAYGDSATALLAQGCWFIESKDYNANTMTRVVGFDRDNKTWRPETDNLFDTGYGPRRWKNVFAYTGDFTTQVNVNSVKVLGAQGAAVADATDAATAITQLNALLARCRAHGLIA